MKTTISQTGFTPLQLHLVSMLNFNTSEESQQRLKKALESFYLSEFELAKETMFSTGQLTEQMIEEASKQHFRTPY